MQQPPYGYNNGYPQHGPPQQSAGPVPIPAARYPQVVIPSPIAPQHVPNYYANNSASYPSGPPTSSISLQPAPAGPRSQGQPLQSQPAQAQSDAIHRPVNVLPQPSYPTPTHSHSKPTPIAAPPPQQIPPLDYQVLLLSLAEEYFNAAHGQGSLVALFQRQADVESYYKLIATGLGCLERVLSNWRLPPKAEATVRLRYAQILGDETDDDEVAETALGKGIALCERNKLLDLKYGMQHLQARLLHRKSPKAALKLLDGIIQDVEAYQHVAWVYAFRFLRVTFSLGSGRHQDSVAAIQHLRAIGNTSGASGDRAVFVLASVYEAMAHLHSSSGESLENAQRALANARTYQLDAMVASIPQLNVMIHFLDLICTLQDYHISQAAEKLSVMQTMMDGVVNDGQWSEDGSFAVSLRPNSTGGDVRGDGSVLQTHDGQQRLMFSWLPKNDVYIVGFLLSGIAESPRNAASKNKAEKFLNEGLRIVRGKCVSLKLFYRRTHIHQVTSLLHGLFQNLCHQRSHASNRSGTCSATSSSN